MFKIRYRIVENLEYLKSLDEKIFDENGDIEGFFSLDFGGNQYGYYHNNPLREGEEGWDLITNWFDSLLEGYLALQTSDYVALSDIESYNTWIEFRKQSNHLNVSIIESEKKNQSAKICIKPFDLYEYGEWKNVHLNINEFREELIKSATQYLKELSHINNRILRSQSLQKIQKLISRIQNEHSCFFHAE